MTNQKCCGTCKWYRKKDSSCIKPDPMFAYIEVVKETDGEKCKRWDKG